MNRDFKLHPEFNTKNGFGFVVAIYNDHPKKEYDTANWYFGILLVCFTFTLNLKYNYKKFMKKQLIDALDKAKLLEALKVLAPDKNYNKLNQTVLREKIESYSYKQIVRALN